MNFFIVTYLQKPGLTLYVESTISGFCIFTKYPSRAKLFSHEDAEQLTAWLKRKKFNEKEKFFTQKFQYETNDDIAVREEKKIVPASNIKTD